MKLIAVATLFALVSAALCGGGGPLKMLDMMMGPPQNIEECMDRMKMKMEIKVAVMEEMLKGKWDCKNTCLNDKQKKCMPDQAFKDKFISTAMDMKKEFMEVKEKARTCIMGKIGSGCSRTPMRYGMCGMGIAKMLIGKETKMCMGDCMMKKMEEKMKEVMGQMARKSGFPPMSEILKMKAKMMKKYGAKGKKKMMMKKMKMMMGMKMKGMCIMNFCEAEALIDCAKSSGLSEMYKKKKAMKMNMMKMMEEQMFPKVCTCLKESATNLPEYLKSFTCAAKPDMEVCGKVHIDYMEMMEKEMKEKEITARKKREAEQLYEMMDDADLDEFDEML